MRRFRHAAVIVVLAACPVLAPAAMAQTAAPPPAAGPRSSTPPAPAARPQRIRGTVKSLTGTTLVIDTREGGTATVQLTPNYSIAAVIPATLADAKPGTFIGTAAAGPKDRLRALEVLIFPDSMKGTGEGHYPWDLQPESTMTNATIESEVAAADGRELTVVAKGETLKVTVPPGTPIVTFVPGDVTLLVPGTHVFVGASRAADGTLTAGRVNAGKDGLTPPM